MVTPVSISNYISLPDDFPVRNIAPQVKEVLKDFIDALSTIICNEEWRTSLNINSATKKIFNNLDNLSYIQRTSFRGNDTLYNEKVQFKLTYPARNSRWFARYRPHIRLRSKYRSKHERQPTAHARDPGSFVPRQLRA